MSIFKLHGAAIALPAIVLGMAVGGGGPAAAGPLAAANGTAVSDHTPGSVHDVRHRRRGGFSIYIGPGYDYGYGYGPRYRTYYYDDGYYDDDYYRPHRHSRRWVRERFEHPLGRR